MLSNVFNKLMCVIALFGTVMGAYWWVARPYQLHWGATREEIARPMPGDELDPSPTFLATRAITIAGTPEQIWPWLLQMGYERAGYYGYDIIENLGSPRGLGSADRILPEFQNFQVGDEVPISAVVSMVFYAIEIERYLVWTSYANDSAFTWALYPSDQNQTRLVSRILWSHHWKQLDVLALDLFTEFTDHLAVRKILQGVKDRVEGRSEPMWRQIFELGVYLASVLIFLAGIGILLVRPLTWGTWLAALAAGLGWLVTWYAPITIWVAILLEIVLLLGIVYPNRFTSLIVDRRLRRK